MVTLADGDLGGDVGEVRLASCASCAVVNSANQSALLPSHRSPEESNTTLQLSGRETTGFGEPDLAISALVNSATSVPLITHRSPEGSKARPPAP